MNKLPHKEGFRTVRIGDVLELVTEIEASTSPTYPFFDANPDSPGQCLYNIISARTCKTGNRWHEHNRIIRTSGLVNTGTPFLFDASQGPIEMPDFYTFWTIKDDTILPQYLILQLYEQYAFDQYCTMDVYIDDKDQTAAFTDTLIYIPDGSIEFSLYEQQRIFNDYRERELARMSAALNMGVGVNGCLAGGLLLKNGRYIIEDYISCGGFGKVYKAKDTRSHQVVAIKELYIKDYCIRKPYNSNFVIPEMARQNFTRQIRKFQNEYDILTKLNGKTKYVPKVIGEPFLENNTIYYAMEYIPDGTLWSNCKDCNLTQQQIINIICQAAIALHHSHDLDYLHLDISPLNIMVDEDGNGRLIDFGSNKHYSNEEGRMTSLGQVAKTKSFAAPELLHQTAGHYYMQSDVYSLAATLYSALTCDIPFSHSKDNDSEFMMHVETKMKESDVPEMISSLILQSLNCDIAVRPATVLEFLKSIPRDMITQTVIAEIADLNKVTGFNLVNHTADLLTSDETDNSEYSE